MPVPDDERLFRFIDWDDFLVEESGVARVRSSLFNLSFPVSFNRASVWSLEHNLAVRPTGWGLCSMTGGEVASVRSQGGQPLYVDPDPIDPPDVDPLLLIPNPSHASANRVFVGKEARRAAKLASANVHEQPTRPVG